MAQKYIFVNNATNTLERVHTDKKFQGKVKFLPERYIHGCPEGTPLGGYMQCNILFDKKFTGPAELYVDAEIFSLDDSHEKQVVAFRCQQMEAFSKTNVTQNIFINNEDKLNLAFLVNNKANFKGVISIRFFLDLGFNNSIHHSLFPFYLETKRLKANQTNVNITVDERKVLHMMMLKQKPPTPSSGLTSPIDFDTMPLNNTLPDLFDKDLLEFTEDCSWDPNYDTMDL